MPQSVWDNIYKGIKDFAGDENKANALIGGGIGAGIGGLIDGWRGAGIGALGGGIAGYKSNDIKKRWNHVIALAEHPYYSLHNKVKRYLKNAYNITDEILYSDYILENVDDADLWKFIEEAWAKK